MPDNEERPSSERSADSAPRAHGSLYRKEAIDHQRERAWGELVVSTPRAARWFARVGVLLAVAFVVFLGTAQYTRKARASAVLAYANDPILVAATEAGMLVSMDVKAGDTVKVGQRLATISTERTAGGEAVFAAGARDADARRAAVSGERKQAQALLNAQQIQLTARINAHEAEAAQLDREIGAQNDRVTQLKLQVERFRQLARDKFAPELQVQQKQDDLAEQAVKLESLKRARTGIDRDLAIARTELPMLRATLEGKLATLSRDEASFVQSSRESLARRAYEVTAANDGTVERVIALSGQSVVIGAPLMQVQTGPRVLIADIYVPTRSAGFLRDGQQVRLAIDAFPMERFGHVAATVTDVGRSVIAPGDAGLPVFVKEASFRVRAQLATPEIVAYGETYPLKSGLSAQADIALDERPLYRWVIEPVLRMRGRL